MGFGFGVPPQDFQAPLVVTLNKSANISTTLQAYFKSL